MFNFILKRGFINDVLFVLGDCYEKSAVGARVFQGMAINTRAQFIASLEQWLTDEKSKLDRQAYGSASEIGDAVHRCQVWVGVGLAIAVYETGATDVPKPIIEKFWKPALYISDQYFMNLRERIPEPFSRSMHDHFDKALERGA
jgi:hypothetical protein